MASTTVRLQRADEDALGYVERVLDRNDLPSGDVRAKPDCFYVATSGGDPVGVGGIEVYGTDGLLRSVVVEESVRGTGYGSTLVDALETTAHDDGVSALYLLTTTAAGFFAARGYDEVDRVEAPDAIRQTTEFADLCPDTATCMLKSL